MRYFINLSNHPSQNWCQEQRRMAQELGELIDLPFPQIPPQWDGEQVDALARAFCDEILTYQDPIVLVQGEFNFTYRLVRLLQQAGIRTLVSCSERRVTEYTDENGDSVKTTTFHFVRFRDYY